VQDGDSKTVTRIYEDRIEGLSLRFRLWMLWKGISKKELLDRYWEKWDADYRKFIEALAESYRTTKS